MLLFENFTYDKEWAEKHYSDIHSTWSYLDRIINDHAHITDLSYGTRQFYIFAVHSVKITNVYGDEIRCYAILRYHDQDLPLENFQKEYIFNRLIKLGDAITILDDNYKNGCAVLITYNIEKDEYRWNEAHEKIQAHEDAVNGVQLPEPEVEDWEWMLKNMYDKKNPTIIFKKFTDLDKVLKYYIISCKLKWAKAFNVIKRILCYNFDLSYEKATYIQEAVIKYCKTYEPDEITQELIDGFKMSFKNDSAIPTKGKPYAAILDKNPLVARYSIQQMQRSSKYDPILIIDVELTNGRKGCISVQQVYLYRLMCYKSREDIGKYGAMIGVDNKYFNNAKNINVCNYLDQAIDEISKDGRV